MSLGLNNMAPSLSSIVPDSKRCLKGEEVSVFNACLTTEIVNPEPAIVCVIPGVYYIDHVINNEECDQLKKEIDNCDDCTFWSSSSRANNAARAFRDADTVEVDCPDFANQIWTRILLLLADSSIEISEDEKGDPLWECDLPGTWNACGLNNELLFARYPPLGAFSPHTDGRAVHNFNKRSFYSVIIFLNDIPAGNGGGTKFYKDQATSALILSATGQWTADKNLCIAEVSPAAGRLLFFDQRLVHEGVPPQPPYTKYIIRTDLMFTRSPPVCDSAKDREAYAWHRKAEELAEKGLVDESIQLFKKAFKMSPELARWMNQR